MRIPIRRLDPGLPLPAAQHDGDAGIDLYAAADCTLDARGGRALVPAGIAIAIPDGYAGFVQPRSGLALRHGVTVVNSPGLVDSGYRDEIKVLLVNLDPVESFKISRGDRIAQLVIQRFELVEWHEVSDLDETERGLSGWGSTG
jgi:dUTP pyrophosphatase